MDDDKLKELLPGAIQAEKAAQEQAALQQRVSADDWAKAKSFATGVTRGGIFAAAAIPGAEAGGTAGAAIGTAIFPGVGTAVGGFLGAGVGALTTGYAGSKLASAAGNELAKHSETIKSFADASNALPQYDEAGNLISMVVPGAVGLAKLGRVGLIRAAEMGAPAAIKLTAKEAGAQALGGAAFEAGIRPAYDWAIQQGKQALGIGGDPNDPANQVQAPTVGSVLENAILGVALGNLGVKFKGYGAEEIGPLYQRYQQAQAEGKDPATVLTTPEIDALTLAHQKLQEAVNKGQTFVKDPAAFNIQVQQAIQGGKTRAITAQASGLSGGNGDIPSPLAPAPLLPGGPSAPPKKRPEFIS